jgi:hypothetical protein
MNPPNDLVTELMTGEAELPEHDPEDTEDYSSASDED